MTTVISDGETDVSRSPDIQPSNADVITNELKVITAVVCALLICEFGLRTAEDSLSNDIRQIKSYKTVAERMESTGGDFKLLFLGNSLTGASIDSDVIVDSIRKATGRRCSITKVVPDNTRLADWTIAFRKFFANKQSLPDAVVLGFRDTDLSDAPSLHPDRLGRYYCDLSDWNMLAERDLVDFASKVEFVTSNQSALFANRHRIRTALLSRVVPDYTAVSQVLNRGSLTEIAPAPIDTAELTYERFVEFNQQLQERGVRLILFAIQTPYQYEIDRELLAVIKSERIPFLDARGVADISPDMYLDGLHMDATAAKLFSRDLAARLGRVEPFAETDQEVQTIAVRRESSTRN